MSDVYRTQASVNIQLTFTHEHAACARTEHKCNIYLHYKRAMFTSLAYSNNFHDSTLNCVEYESESSSTDKYTTKSKIRRKIEKNNEQKKIKKSNIARNRATATAENVHAIPFASSMHSKTISHNPNHIVYGSSASREIKEKHTNITHFIHNIHNCSSSICVKFVCY